MLAKERLKALNIYDDEKQFLQTKIHSLETNLEEMEKSLKKLTGIEEKIYYEIVVNNNNVTRAIDKVAFDIEKDSSTLWKYYYPKVKREINQLKNSE